MMRVLAFLLLTGCAVPNPWRDQRDYAQSLKPAEVAAGDAATGAPLRVLKVRAYADAEYQAQTPRWNARIEEQVHRASAILEKQFGARLEVESVRSWPALRQGSSLRDALANLEAQDPGKGVEWVVGFVSSLRMFSAAQEELGVARLFGRHLVLRGMFSAAETDALDRALPLLSQTEREQLGRERRAHKETAVFLHEWAHTMGAFHERSPHSLMAPTYDIAQSSFSEASARIVGLALDYRDAPEGRERWAAAYREEVKRSATLAWDSAALDEALLAASALAGAGAPQPEKQKLPETDAQALQRVLALRTAQDYGRAEALLQPIAERHPENDEVQDLACSLAQERGAPAQMLLSACRAAAKLPGAPAEILLATAHIMLSQAQRAEAVPLLSRAEAKLGSAPEGWLYLAALELEAGACSAADRSAARAGEAKGAARIREESARIRRQVGFPPQAEALTPERESEYVTAALAAHRQIDERKLDAARVSATALRAAFAGMPAAAVVECRINSRGRALEPIRTACAKAAAAAPDAFFPQYVAGLVASAEGRWPEAGAALQRAIHLDDSAPQIWQSLAAVARKLHDDAVLRDLQQRFRARFKSALRPALWPAGWAAR
jgi:predicted Zn-dependent protease